jgi:hypothetical protein
MKQEYYRKNINKWKKGGEYYYYKPKEHKGEVIFKRGIFILNFD